MLFTQLSFVYFHLAVIALRWLLPRAAVQPLLLLSSYIFYLSWGVQYGLLIGAMTLTGWGIGLLMERYPSRRRVLLGLGVSALLSVLGYFKYANFLAAQWTSLLALFGAEASPARLDVVLPLAISFFTFEVISYAVDVYRGEPAERSLARFALYVAYYPHLIAGPIVRAHELLPRLRSDRAFDGKSFAEGVFIGLLGYVKKAVIADNLSPWADAVFANPGAYSTFGAWLGVAAYTGQIYCDFSGYTDIARGASLMLGYPLPENFDRPYLSTSITEFWRRWHMTLSRWLRDYLYIPLGGSRHGALAQYRNLLLTMLLGGLWHGANWTFVAWGGLHGVALALHKPWAEFMTRRAAWLQQTLPYRVLSWALTLLIVMLGWICFRAPSFELAGDVLRRMFSDVNGAGELGSIDGPALLAVRMTLLLAFGHLLGARNDAFVLHERAPALSRGLVWLALLALCFLFAESRAQFIYFQF